MGLSEAHTRKTKFFYFGLPVLTFVPLAPSDRLMRLSVDDVAIPRPPLDEGNMVLIRVGSDIQVH